jgi:hypothetical protein
MKEPSMPRPRDPRPEWQRLYPEAIATGPAFVHTTCNCGYEYEGDGTGLPIPDHDHERYLLRSRADAFSHGRLTVEAAERLRAELAKAEEPENDD